MLDYFAKLFSSEQSYKFYAMKLPTVNFEQISGHSLTTASNESNLTSNASGHSMQ